MNNKEATIQNIEREFRIIQEDFMQLIEVKLSEIKQKLINVVTDPGPNKIMNQLYKLYSPNAMADALDDFCKGKTTQYELNNRLESIFSHIAKGEGGLDKNCKENIIQSNQIHSDRLMIYLKDAMYEINRSLQSQISACVQKNASSLKLAWGDDSQAEAAGIEKLESLVQELEKKKILKFKGNKAFTQLYTFVKASFTNKPQILKQKSKYKKRKTKGSAAALLRKTNSAKKSDVTSNKEDEEEEKQLVCSCNKPYQGEFLIGCETCSGWYHPECVKFPFKNEDASKIKWICPSCEEKLPKPPKRKNPWIDKPLPEEPKVRKQVKKSPNAKANSKNADNNDFKEPHHEPKILEIQSHK
jgi:hypothetical protein